MISQEVLWPMDITLQYSQPWSLSRQEWEMYSCKSVWVNDWQESLRSTIEKLVFSHVLPIWKWCQTIIWIVLNPLYSTLKPQILVVQKSVIKAIWGCPSRGAKSHPTQIGPLLSFWSSEQKENSIAHTAVVDESLNSKSPMWHLSC